MSVISNQLADACGMKRLAMAGLKSWVDDGDRIAVLKAALAESRKREKLSPAGSPAREAGDERTG